MVAQTIDAFRAEVLGPLGDRLCCGVELPRRGGVEKPIIHQRYETSSLDLSASKAHSMRVYSAPRESLRFGNISVHGQIRMDNLPKVHS